MRSLVGPTSARVCSNSIVHAIPGDAGRRGSSTNVGWATDAVASSEDRRRRVAPFVAELASTRVASA